MTKVSQANDESFKTSPIDWEKESNKQYKRFLFS